MLIEYIDHKINEEIRTENVNTDIGKWIIKEMISNNLFISNNSLPVKMNKINITVNKIIINNTNELDINTLYKVYTRKEY